jgi:hypothetical protein
MNTCFSITRTLSSVIAGTFLVLASVASATDVLPATDTQKPGNYQIFYQSSPSQGFDVDPKFLEADFLQRLGLPKPQLIYTTRAYSNAIYSYPQTEMDQVTEDPMIVYVDQGYGQAIYSYPSNVGRGLIIGLPREVY